jgi:hypothetical protein
VRLIGSSADAKDALVDILCAVRRLLHAAGNFSRRRALLINGGCDLAGDMVDLGDGSADCLDGADGLAGGGLDTLNLRGNLFRRFCSQLGHRVVGMVSPRSITKPYRDDANCW